MSEELTAMVWHIVRPRDGQSTVIPAGMLVTVSTKSSAAAFARPLLRNDPPKLLTAIALPQLMLLQQWQILHDLAPKMEAWVYLGLGASALFCMSFDEVRHIGRHAA